MRKKMLLPSFILAFTGIKAMDKHKLEVELIEQQKDEATKKRVAELLAKHTNPPKQINQDTSGYFDDYYKNRPLVNPEGKMVCFLSLGDPFPKEAIDENGKLKPGWKWHIPLAE